MDNYVENLQSVGSPVSNDFLSNNQFNKPNAGIKSINVNTIGQMGLVKETIVNFKVFNYFDYENIVIPFFMTPGSRLFIDFGWDTSLIYNPSKFISGEGNNATFEYETFNEKIYGENKS